MIPHLFSLNFPSLTVNFSPCYPQNMLSKSKFRILSEIARDIAQVFFASVVVAPLIAGLRDVIVISLGILGSIVFWWFSILFAIRGKL